MKRAFALPGVALAVAAAVGACSHPSAPADSEVHAITLPEIPAPDLPDAPGKAAFVGACSTCHTTRYLLDQPRFPRKTWTAEVTKMKKTYGASIPDELTPSIVDYLVAAHGTGD